MKLSVCDKLLFWFYALQLKTQIEIDLRKQRGLYTSKQLKRHLTFLAHNPHKNFSKYHYHIVG